MVSRAGAGSLWLSFRSESTDELLRAISSERGASQNCRGRLGDLLMLQPPRERTLPILHGSFGRVIGEARSFRTLPPDQLAEVLSAREDQARELFIGGAVDPESGTLALVRGDLDRVIVPLSIFRPSGTSKPDFRRFELDDHGHAIRFGGYEAAAEFVLYEVDPEYRRRVNAKRRDEERGFGPSLRRLRIQRGLSRDDFPGVSAKTIARIERGEVERPHGRTLRVIAEVLDVEPGEIEGYR